MNTSDFVTWLGSLNANDWAIFATWAGTILSLFSFLGIRALRATHLAKIRLPELLKELRAEAKNISSTLIDASQFTQRSTEYHEYAITVCSILKSIANKTVPKELKRDATALAASIGKSKPNTWTHDSASSVYYSIRSIEKLLAQTIKDLEA